VTFATVTLCVASQRVFIVVRVYFVTDLSPETFGYTLVRRHNTEDLDIKDLSPLSKYIIQFLWPGSVHSLPFEPLSGRYVAACSYSEMQINRSKRYAEIHVSNRRNVNRIPHSTF
jgi:hypothetical protein